MPVVVKAHLVFEDEDCKETVVDIHSVDGVKILTTIWPGDLDLVHAIVSEITRRRDRYPSKRIPKTGDRSGRNIIGPAAPK